MSLTHIVRIVLISWLHICSLKFFNVLFIVLQNRSVLLIKHKLLNLEDRQKKKYCRKRSIHTTLFRSFSLFFFHQLLESGNAISIHLDPFIFFRWPQAKSLKSWRKRQVFYKEKYPKSHKYGRERLYTSEMRLTT